MTSRSLNQAVLVTFAALVVVLGRTARDGQAQTSSTVSGAAYGAFVQTATGELARSPLAVLDPAGGMADAELASISVPGVLAAQSVSSITTGVIGENAASSQSSAVLQNVSILNGLITAKAVLGMASSVGRRGRAESNSAGSTLVGLAIKGVAVADGEPAPNTRIELPGVGAVILNEQIPSGDGRTTSGLTVNMIHLLMQDALTGARVGEVIVASSRSEAAFGR